METTKQCIKCNEFKLITEFYKKTSAKDGHQSCCKQCKKQYYNNHYQVNKTEIIEKQKQYYQNHKTETADYQRLRRKNDAQYRLICNLRTRLSNCIKNKAQTTRELIGIPFNIFINWIEFQMPAGFSTDDLGKKEYAVLLA